MSDTTAERVDDYREAIDKPGVPRSDRLAAGIDLAEANALAALVEGNHAEALTWATIRLGSITERTAR